MAERALGPVEVRALRIGRTDVGAATAVIDDEALTLVVRAEPEEKRLRLRFVNIDSVHRAGDELELVLRDGTRVSIVAVTGSSFSDDLLDRCRSVPELTRTLRAFGSRRGRRNVRETDASEQQRFFAPLLDARRAAAQATPGGAASIAAFGGSALLLALEQTLQQFAADLHAEPGPARRALEAELVDASEPLVDALRALRDAGAVATESVNDLRLWRVWSYQLRATFEAADRVWVALDEVLDDAHRRRPAPAPKR